MVLLGARTDPARRGAGNWQQYARYRFYPYPLGGLPPLPHPGCRHGRPAQEAPGGIPRAAAPPLRGVPGAALPGRFTRGDPAEDRFDGLPRIPRPGPPAHRRGPAGGCRRMRSGAKVGPADRRLFCRSCGDRRLQLSRRGGHPLPQLSRLRAGGGSHPEKLWRQGALLAMGDGEGHAAKPRRGRGRGETAPRRGSTGMPRQEPRRTGGPLPTSGAGPCPSRGGRIRTPRFRVGRQVAVLRYHAFRVPTGDTHPCPPGGGRQAEKQPSP